MKYKRLVIILVSSAFLLLIPLIAMQFTDEVNWTLLDFVVAGLLLFGFGLLIEFVLRKINKKYRLVIILSLFVVFLLIWVELAVGLFGTIFAGQ